VYNKEITNRNKDYDAFFAKKPLHLT